MEEERRAVSAMMVAHIPRLRRYARTLTGDAERADDLVQDCLERALSRLHLWRRGTDLRAWLFTIMHNIHANLARRYNNGPKFVPLEYEEERSMIPSNLDASLSLHDLEVALSRLSVEQREVIVLVSVEEMKYKEVADMLGVPVGTVMSRLHRAREQLREIMSEKRGPGLRRVK